MLHNIMQIFSKIFGSIVSSFCYKPGVYSVGPNNFAELMKQFDVPPKIKTQQEIVRDYQIKETMAALELDMLRMDPSVEYLGTYTWHEAGKKCFDFVPCVVRPEVVYCSYGKN